ncbi:MAG: BACON domain-containing protein, partial [Alistipes sp.]|nr:BACON domain-containing protein [Alistipes sp.]
MRKIYGFLMTVAVVATAFISCTNSDNTIDSTQTETPTKGVYRQLAFAADNESGESRTHHTGETIHWSKGDRIRISYTRDGVWQNADGREAGAEVAAKLYTSDEQSTDSEFSVFRVTQLFNDPETEGELVFYGLYPSEATKGNKPDFADSEAGLVNVSIPQIQSPSATSFDGMADLLVARSRNTYSKFPTYEEQISMFWTRLVAHGMLTLKGLSAVEGYMDDETIEYVEFEVDPSVALAGDFSLDLAGQTIAPTSAKNKIRLTYADNEEHNTLDGDGNFVVWFASAPFTTESIAITVATNRAIYTRTFASANKTFKVNTRSLLGINMSGAERTARTMVDMFELVTDASVLAAGKKVVIAAKDFDVAMSTSKSSTYRNQTAIEKDGNFISIDSTVEVFELREGTADGTWAFYESDYGYIYQSNGTLKSTKNLSSSCNWVVEVADTGVATISAKSSASTKIQYNISKSYFRTYTSAQSDIALYHNVPSTTPLMSQMSAAPVITTAEETESNIVNVAWTHDLTGMTLTGLYYTVTCSMEGEEDVVYSSITETEFVVDNLAAGEWSITVTAHADNHYPITSEPMLVTVLGATPTLTIEPTELLFEGAGGTQQIEVMAKNLGSNVKITAESDTAAFTTSVSVTTVSVRASKNPDTAERSGKITITAAGSKATLQVEVAVLQEIGQIIYKKVSGTLKDFSGQYLIVCESENLAFDGSLSELNAFDNNFIVSVRNGEIALAAANNDIYFTIEKVTSGYAIKSASGMYIGATSNKTTLDTSTTTKHANTISFNGNEMDIVSSGGAYLRFNNASTSLRFSYYPSTSFTGYLPIQLYKLDGTGNDEMLTPLDAPVPTATVNANTITVSWPEV